MKIQYKQSIREQIDSIIDSPEGGDIAYIELNAHEYIQFLEEISDLQRILLIDPTTKKRTYRNTLLKVLTA